MNKRNTLVTTEPLHEALLAWDYPGEERVKYAVLGMAEGATERRFLLREVLAPALDDYTRRGPASAAMRASFVFGVYRHAFVKALPAVAFVHTHPGAAFVSGTDQRDAERHRNVAFDFASVYLQIVVGRDGDIVGIAHFPDGRQEPIDRIVRIRSRGVSVLPTANGRSAPDQALDMERHRRTVEIGGDVAQALGLIAGLRWGVIGTGGGGAAFLNAFKFLGPQTVVLVDPQTLERSNANRFMGYRDGDDGRPKVEVLARELRAFDPEMTVETIQAAFPSEAADAALAQCDALVVIPDHHWVRVQAAGFAARHLQPLFEGGAGVFVNDDGTPYRISCATRLQLPPPIGPCLRCMGVTADVPPQYDAIVEAARRSYVKGAARSRPTPASVVTLLSQLGTLVARQILYYLSSLGGPEGALPRHLVWDEIPLALEDLSALWKREPECPICGDGSLWAYGGHVPRLPSPAELASVDGELSDSPDHSPMTARVSDTTPASAS